MDKFINKLKQNLNRRDKCQRSKVLRYFNEIKNDLVYFTNFGYREINLRVNLSKEGIVAGRLFRRKYSSYLRIELKISNTAIDDRRNTFYLIEVSLTNL